MKLVNLKQEKGFSILAVILVIVAVIVAIGVWALSGQTNTSNSATSSVDIQAASLINDSGAIKSAFDSLLIGGANATSIVFTPNTASTTAAPNMLDPSTGIQVPKVNSNAIRTGATAPEGLWLYNGTNFKGWNVGTVSGKDQVIMVFGIKTAVCQRVNAMLYGATSVPQPYTSDTGLTMTGSATATDPNFATAMDFFAAAGLNGWVTGCFSLNSSQPDQNAFFRVLKAN